MPYFGSKGPGWGGEANGLGWGGPARGEGAHNPRKPFRRGRSANPAGPNCERSERSLLKQQRSEAIEDVLWNLIFTAEPEMIRVLAAARLHEMYNGKPIAQTLNANTDNLAKLSDVELATELERLDADPAPMKLAQ